LYELGISGTAGAADRRRALLQKTGLPLRLSKKALLEVVNSLYTYEEFAQICTQE
jgi:ribonuclease M5